MLSWWILSFLNNKKSLRIFTKRTFYKRSHKRTAVRSSHPSLWTERYDRDSDWWKGVLLKACRKTGQSPFSNTGMAVVPDSNRISFFIYSANNFSTRIFYFFPFYHKACVLTSPIFAPRNKRALAMQVLFSGNGFILPVKNTEYQFSEYWFFALKYLCNFACRRTRRKK